MVFGGNQKRIFGIGLASITMINRKIVMQQRIILVLIKIKQITYEHRTERKNQC